MALYPNNTYDAGGVWSGSASFQADGTPVLLYTAVGYALFVANILIYIYIISF